MTRKDYQKAAELINAHIQAMIKRDLARAEGPLLEYEDIVLAHVHMTNLMVEFFRSDNPNFKEGEFREACPLPSPRSQG